jgi:putative oxidoreductase
VSTLGSDFRVASHAQSRGIGALIGWLAYLAAIVAPLFLRAALAIPFFRSGLTKWDGLSLSTSATYLFANEFKLHIFGAAYDFPFPGAAALLSACGEIAFPVLLVLGLATRFAALGILAMTAVIQLVVPDGWLTYHLPWAAMALALVALGPGALSLDRLIARLIRA